MAKLAAVTATVKMKPFKEIRMLALLSAIEVRSRLERIPFRKNVPSKLLLFFFFFLALFCSVAISSCILFSNTKLQNPCILRIVELMHQSFIEGYLVVCRIVALVSYNFVIICTGFKKYGFHFICE